jgi:poly-beta-1,6-N-acetyl-D-glucosamine synthase
MSAAIVLLSASVALAYVVVIYPVLLAIIRRTSSHPPRRGSETPSVSVIVPVHNGEAFFEAKLISLLALDYPKDRLEILVASDGSTDRTNEIVKRFAGVRLLALPRGGKCAALNAAIPLVSGEIVFLTDVRQIVEPCSLRYLVRNFADPAVGVVSGHLKIRGAKPGESADIGAYWRFETWIRDSLSSIDSMFGATGPFYALRRSLAVPIPPDILLDDMYLPLALFRRGYRLIVDAEAVAWDYPTDLKTEFRRKVRTMAGNYQLLMHYPWLLTPANRMWFHFLSYKAGRLLLPWLLIAIGGSSLLLSSPWRIVACLPQLAIYLVAAAHPLLPRRAQRFSSPLRTFAVMMLAVLGGLQVIFVPARRLWKVTGATAV